MCVDICKSWHPTCHVTIDELRIYGSTAVHINVKMSRCVTFVFVRLTWLLMYCCIRHNELIKGGWLHWLHAIPLYCLKTSWWQLTAVAGGSSVASVGAITVEGAPWLRTSSTMFAVAGRTPERHEEEDTKTDRKKKKICQNVSPKSSKTIFVSESLCWTELKNVPVFQKKPAFHLSKNVVIVFNSHPFTLHLVN